MVQCFRNQAGKGAEEDPCITAGGLAERPAGSRLADPHSEVLDSGCGKAVQTAEWGRLGFLPRPQGRLEAAPQAPKPGRFHLVSCLAALCDLIRWSLPGPAAGYPSPTLHQSLPVLVPVCQSARMQPPDWLPPPQPPSEPFGRPTRLRSRSRRCHARHVLIVTRFGPPLPPGNTQKACGMDSLPQAAALMDRLGVYMGLCPSATSKMSALGSSSSHWTPPSQSQGSRHRRLCRRRSPTLTYIQPNPNTSTRLGLLVAAPAQHCVPTAHHAALHLRHP